MERPLTERLYIYALDWRLRTSNQEIVVEAAKEIVRLETENLQLKQACGYPIPADKETINNPFKCGTCDARAAQSQDRDGSARDASSHPIAAGESPAHSLVRAIDHTLTVHGKIDADTRLHDWIRLYLANQTPNPDDRTDGKHETNLS